MSVSTHIQSLINEGKQLALDLNENQWRLAKIMAELSDSGMIQTEIADQLGLKQGTVSRYLKVQRSSEYSHENISFTDALLYINMSAERAAAVDAVAEVEGISPHTAKVHASVKEIAAAISGLPDEQKEQVAKELALDAKLARDVAHERIRQIGKDFGDRVKTRRREHGPVKEPKTGLDGMVVLSTISRIASDLASLDKDVKGHDFSVEEKELFVEYVTDIRLKLDALMVSIDAADWDMEELKI